MEASEQIAEPRESADEKFKNRAALTIACVANNNIHARDAWAFYQAQSIRPISTDKG